MLAWINTSKLSLSLLRCSSRPYTFSPSRASGRDEGDIYPVHYVPIHYGQKYLVQLLKRPYNETTRWIVIKLKLSRYRSPNSHHIL